MKIALGCDHAGFALKDAVVKFLDSRNKELMNTTKKTATLPPVYVSQRQYQKRKQI